jgi:RNA polymerase sigma-70 factor (ECF subfamily)
MDGVDPLVRRAQAGDERALHELFVRHRADVARIVFRTLGPDADLDDIVQEAFIQIFRSISRFQGNAKFTTWLYRVVTNVARMHLRSRRARPQLALGIEHDHLATASDNDAPDEVAQRHARQRALYRHLDQLSDKKRTVLVLHDFEGLSPTVISEIVEAPILTVRTRLFYARRELYAALSQDPALADVAAALDEESGPPRDSKPSGADQP